MSGARVDPPPGLPLLSGPPPEPPLHDRSATDNSCRKCNKEFNLLFARGRRCNHCGYSYCYPCSDYQALMPRRSGDAGYDCMPVCAFCIQYLQITAGGKSFLRSLSSARLKNYMQAYGLKLGADVLEKDDIINAIIAARTEHGCLPRVNENYYRKHSVPSGQTSRPRGIFSNRSERAQPRQFLDPQTRRPQDNFARPDLQQSSQPDVQQQRINDPGPGQRQQQQQNPNSRNRYAPPPGPPPNAQYTPPPWQNPTSTPGSYVPPYPQYQRPSSVPQGHGFSSSNNSFPSTTSNQGPNGGHTPSSRPATAPPPQDQSPSSRYQPPPHPPPRPRVPTLDELLSMQEEEIPSLSIGVLKDILTFNHVRMGPNVLEKSELVAKVLALVADERREREHAEAVREREMWEAQEREWETRERERERREQQREAERLREEIESKRGRDAYRTTMEDASESDESLDQGVPSSRDEQTRPVSPAPPAPEKEEDRDGDAIMVESERSKSPSSARSQASAERAEKAERMERAERSGLCVVCQDEDANIVIIDCGHLALCRGCSDLVWSTTRECPLCRTRIVTQARFLRVFKT